MASTVVSVAVAYASATGCAAILDIDGIERAAPADGSAPVVDGDIPRDATSGEAAPDAAAECPGVHGPRMLRIAPVVQKAFCIDVTEVTQDQYREFVDASIDPQTQPEACRLLNPSFTPSCTTPPAVGSNLPQVCVDWCDADAFCRWAGKRLCGAIGGGAGAFPDQNASGDEWAVACTREGQQTHPYTAAPDPTLCNVRDDLEPVGTRPGCEGGYPGLFDMGGNAAEWINACGAVECTAAGGSFATGDTTKCVSKASLGRGATRIHVGFRCCADAR